MCANVLPKQMTQPKQFSPRTQNEFSPSQRDNVKISTRPSWSPACSLGAPKLSHAERVGRPRHKIIRGPTTFTSPRQILSCACGGHFSFDTKVKSSIITATTFGSHDAAATRRERAIFDRDFNFFSYHCLRGGFSFPSRFHCDTSATSHIQNRRWTVVREGQHIATNKVPTDAEVPKPLAAHTAARNSPRLWQSAVACGWLATDRGP